MGSGRGFMAVKLTADDKKSRCSWVSGLRFFGGCSAGEACLYDDVVENARDAGRIDGHEHILRAGLARHRAGAMVDVIQLLVVKHESWCWRWRGCRGYERMCCN